MRMFPRALMFVVLLAVAAEAAPRRIAVAYFDNNTGKAELDPLRKGLADMLITDLSGLSSIQVVEREKLNQVLDELKLSKSKFVDPKTAQKLGKGLAAELILTGHYVVQGKKMRIDARVIRVETGAVAASDTVEGDQEEFFGLEKDLVDLLVRTLELKLDPDEKRKLRANPTQSYEAWSKYSAGLDAKDRGEDDKARELFEQALQADPSYRAAKTQNERLGAVVNAVQERQAANQGKVIDQIKKMNPKAPDYATSVQAAFISFGVGGEGVAKHIELLTYLAEKDLRPVAGGLMKSYPESLFLLALAGSYRIDPETVELLPGVYEYVWKKYPDDPMLTGSNMRDLPKNAEKEIAAAKDMKAKGNVFFETTEWYKPYVDNRAAAQKLFKLVAQKAKK